MKRILIMAITLFGIYPIMAQQRAMFTHYMNNSLAVNPAYAGTRDALTVTGIHRSQWVGFDGAPTTQTLTAHSPILKDKLGIGISILNDKIGPVNTTSFNVDLAYNIKVSKVGRLAFGIKSGLNVRRANLTSLNLDQDNDIAFANNVESKLLPNFGFGAYYYSTTWYVGVSAPALLENRFESNQSVGSVSGEKENRHYFLIAGTVVSLNQSGSLKLKPSTLVKMTMGAPLEAELTGLLIINDQVELGAMFRIGDAVGLLMGYNINPRLNIGYSFDWSFTNKTSVYNSGSHEIMVRYDFIFNGKPKVRSPRYF